MKIQSSKKATQFTLVYIIIVISFFDNFSHIPIMSIFARSLGSSIFFASLIVSAYSMSNMVGNFYSGSFIDKFGRAYCMTYGLLISCLAVFCYSLVLSSTQLLLVRILHGLGMAVVIPAAFALIGDLSSETSRGQDMAKSGIAISIAALLGPPIGGTIKTIISLDFLFYLVAILLFIGAIICRFFISETFYDANLPLSETKNDDGVNPEIKVSIFCPELLIAYLGALLLMIAKGTLIFALPLHSENLGFSAATTGILFSCFAISAIIIFATPFNRLSDRKGRFTSIILGLVLITLSLGLLGYGNKMFELVPIMLLYGVGFGILFPASTALVVDFTEVKDRGRGFGIFYGVFSLGVVIGPVVAGAVSEWINPFHTASILVLVGLIPMYLLYLKIKNQVILFKS